MYIHRHLPVYTSMCRTRSRCSNQKMKLTRMQIKSMVCLYSFYLLRDPRCHKTVWGWGTSLKEKDSIFLELTKRAHRM